MEKKKTEKPAGEVVTFKEIAERHKNIKKEELMKFVLICKNCNHKDLLINFIKIKNRFTKVAEPLYSPPKKPSFPPNGDWFPKPKWINKEIPPYTIQSSNKKKINCLVLDDEEYEDYFFCPVCKSSLVVISSDFTKNNIARVLGENKNEKMD